MVGHPTIPKVRTRVRRTDAKHPMSDVEALEAPTRIKAPPQLTRGDDDAVAQREQRITQCELLMLKGFTTPTSIQGMMGWDRKTTERFMDLVQARWEITGGNKNFEAKRGQQLARMDNLMQEAWVLYQNMDEMAPDGKGKLAPSPKIASVKLRILVAIGAMNKQLSDLHGITARSVAKQMLSSTDRGDFIKRMEKQKKLADVAGALAELLKKRQGDDAKVIEGTEG